MIKVTLIVLVVFFLLFGGLGFYFMSQVGSKQKEGSLERQLEQRREEKRKLLAKMEELAKAIGEQELKIAECAEQKDVVDQHLAQLRAAKLNFDSLQARRKSHSENLQSAERKISSALDGGGDDNAATIQALRSKKEDFESGYTKRREELQNTSDDITKELSKQTVRYQRRRDEKRKLRDRLETEIVQIREELQKYMVRELPDVDMGHDGVVLTVDIESRQAGINIGKRQGVKCGMRFEVFQLRQGSKRVHKGYLDIRSVERETASCTIVDMAIRLPRCPADGYTARYPEERFCPYCTGSAGGARVQRLSAIPRETNMGMDTENPIVAGDLIQNPLFDPGRQLHFAVKGDAENPVGQHRMEDFVAAIKWHGGLVDADLTAQTDLLLAGKYAMDETRKARELGVRVLREYEVFDFLRQ